MDGYWAERQLYMQISWITSNEEKIPLANLSCLTGRDRIEVRFLEKCVNLEKITQNHIFLRRPLLIYLTKQVVIVLQYITCGVMVDNLGPKKQLKRLRICIQKNHVEHV